MHLSIVIPTFNREQLLHTTVPALLNQKIADDISYEVIFVINGSSDGTKEYLLEVEKENPGKLRSFYIAPTGGPSAPRNRGIREATGDVVIILDDDVLPDDDLVQHFADHHAQHPDLKEAAIGEAYVPDELKPDPMSVFHTFPYDKIRDQEQLSYIYFWTCCISFKREFMLEHGMFDERFLYNEDLVCGNKLYKQGMVLRFCQPAKGKHLHQGNLRDQLSDKGTYIGRWIWATVEHIREPEIIDRYGVLSSRLPPLRYLKRLINRIGFRLIDNPVTHQILRLLGAEKEQRSRISDLYYYIQFRRAIVSGYKTAQKEARIHGHSTEQKRLLTPLEQQ